MATSIVRPFRRSIRHGHRMQTLVLAPHKDRAVGTQGGAGVHLHRGRDLTQRERLLRGDADPSAADFEQGLNEAECRVPAAACILLG